MYHYQCSRECAREILENMIKNDKNAKEKMMYDIMHKEERRELEQVSFTFQIPISLSILTHLTRHRMHSLLIPEFLPMWNMKKLGVKEADLVYFYLGNQMVNVMTTMNARNIQWVCRLRCCNKAQWQIRFIANDMRKQVMEVAPLIGKGLGATCMTDRICNEGRECCGLIDKLLEADNKNK